jgi:hypothetical protein
LGDQDSWSRFSLSSSPTICVSAQLTNDLRVFNIRHRVALLPCPSPSCLMPADRGQSQRSPRRASRATAQLPPPEAAVHTCRLSPRTVARASVEASAARIERAWQRPSCHHPRQHTCRLSPHLQRAWQQPSCRHPRQHTCRLSPHRGARPRRSQRSPH